VSRGRRDVVVLVASLAVFAACAVIAADGRVGPIERATFQAVNGLPDWLYQPMLAFQYLGVLAMPPVPRPGEILSDPVDQHALEVRTEHLVVAVDTFLELMPEDLAKLDLLQHGPAAGGAEHRVTEGTGSRPSMQVATRKSRSVPGSPASTLSAT
jgi:hypothetical protein